MARNQFCSLKDWTIEKYQWISSRKKGRKLCLEFIDSSSWRCNDQLILVCSGLLSPSVKTEAPYIQALCAQENENGWSPSSFSPLTLGFQVKSVILPLGLVLHLQRESRKWPFYPPRESLKWICIILQMEYILNSSTYRFWYNNSRPFMLTIYFFYALPIWTLWQRNRHKIMKSFTRCSFLSNQNNIFFHTLGAH